MDDGPSLAVTVATAVVTIAFTGSPGFVAGLLGLIDQDFLRILARFKLTCLTPCLIFSTFGSRLTAARLGKVWPLALWSCGQIAAGAFISRGICRACPQATWAQPRSMLAQLLQLALCFQNIGAFSLPMLETLCQSPGLFKGHAQSCFEDGTLMIFGYHVPWDAMMWTHGYATVSALACAQAEPVAQAGASIPRCRSGRLKDILHRLAVLAKGLRAAAAHFCNPIFFSLLCGVLVGLTPPLRRLFFGSEALLQPVGMGLKRVGGIVPVLALQILSGTLGCASRQVWLDLRHEDAGLPQPTGTVGRALKQNAALIEWVLATLVGKMMIVPLVGFSICALLSWIQQDVGPALDAVGAAAPRPSNSLLLTPLAWTAKALWPDDQLLRCVVVLQWSAPSCLSLISLCYRVGLGRSVTQAVAALYLVMYVSTVFCTTFWVSAGLAVF